MNTTWNGNNSQMDFYPDSLHEYKKRVQRRINRLTPIFAKAAIGKFDKDVDFPDKEDEFTPLYAGIQIMLEVIRRQVKELTENNMRLYNEKQELEKAKDEFISIAAHQLRTPLSIMRLNLEMSRKKAPEKEDLNKIFTNIYNSNLKMIDLVNDLLNIAKIENSKSEGNPKSIKLVPIIKKASKQFKDELKRKNIMFQFNGGGLNPIVFIDRYRLFEVLSNILSNAIKYSKSKKGKVSLDISNDTNLLKIIISDNGIGIPSEEHYKIFSKFFRTNIARISEANGSGLGLFIAKTYVESWGGTIGFKSPLYKNNTGTSVFFTIPI